MKQLSIIITYHNETREQVRRAFASVTMQVDVDFSDIEVALIGDGVAAMPNDLFQAPRGLVVRQLNYQPSRGAGVARQVGIDHTAGNYFMFIDADDELSDVFALRDMLAPTREQDHDLIIARYTKQQYRRDGFNYALSAKYDWKAAYGKLYHREYIKRIGLTWHPDLRIFEDTYFVGLACELAQDRFYLDKPVYVWLWNPKSTVRKNGHEFDHQLHTWAESNRYILEVLRQQKPSVWPRDFYEYMADLFYREKQHPAVDPDAFIAEHTKLLVENRSLWTDEGQEQVRKLIIRDSEPGGRRVGWSTAGMEKYLSIQMKLLRHAFDEVQNHE